MSGGNTQGGTPQSRADTTTACRAYRHEENLYFPSGKRQSRCPAQHPLPDLRGAWPADISHYPIRAIAALTVETLLFSGV